MKSRKFFKGLLALMLVAGVVRKLKRHKRLGGEARPGVAAWRRHPRQSAVV